MPQDASDLIEADAIALYENAAAECGIPAASWSDAPEWVRALVRLAARDPVGLARRFGGKR
jgi:hypothetical protein